MSADTSVLCIQITCDSAENGTACVDTDLFVTGKHALRKRQEPKTKDRIVVSQSEQKMACLAEDDACTATQAPTVAGISLDNNWMGLRDTETGLAAETS